MDPKILDKIRKCLALCTSPNEHEAAAGLRQAQKLMQMHGVTDMDIKTAAVAEARAKASTWEHMKSWESSLAWTVGKIFGCKSYYTAGSSWRKELGDWAFYGPKGRQELASHAFTVLQRIVVKRRAKFVAGLPEHWSRGRKGAEAEAYISGFLATVLTQCAPLVPDAEETEALTLYGTKRGLVTKTFTGRGGSMDAYNAGRADGSNNSLHVPMNGANETRRLT